jgi:Zn-dependent M28 family amino/carboxypeptidase
LLNVRGTNPKAGSIVLAAHYDSVLNSPGADDNASGVAVVLEMARLFAEKPTPRTLKIVFFDQEEVGLLGSFAFTGKPENLTNLQAAIILDMVGYACHTPGCQTYPQGLNVTPILEASGIEFPDRGEFLTVVGEVQNLPLLKIFQSIDQSLRKLAAFSVKIPPLVAVPIPLKGLLTPDVLRSDHAPFWYQGIPAVLMTDTANLRSPHYHQPTDTISNLDPEFFQGSAQIIYNVIAELLNSQTPLTVPDS